MQSQQARKSARGTLQYSRAFASTTCAISVTAQAIAATVRTTEATAGDTAHSSGDVATYFPGSILTSKDEKA